MRPLGTLFGIGLLISIAAQALSQVPGLEKGSVEAAIQAHENAARDAETTVQSGDPILGPDDGIGFDVPQVGGMRELKVGDWGRFVDRFQAFQVIDKDKMLVSYYYVPSVRVLMLKGVSTKKIADNQHFGLRPVCRISGTTSYTTVTGAKKTILVIEPLSAKERQELLKRQRQRLAAEKERLAAAKAAERDRLAAIEAAKRDRLAAIEAAERERLAAIEAAQSRTWTNEDEGDDVARLVEVMTSAEEPWEKRSEAEQKLETLSSSAVLEHLLPHVSKPMPEGPIYNSGGREGDRLASVPWQIHYAAGRVWSHHASSDNSVAPTLIRLLKRAKTHHGKDRVLNAMHRCWIPEMEKPVAEAFFATEENERSQLAACYVLSYRNIKPYLPTLVERAGAVKAGEQNEWLEILLGTRVKHKSGILKSVTELGFKQLEADRKRGPRSLAAYGTARRLESYLDQNFVPPDIKPDDARFFDATIENALKWWRQNR